MKSSLFLLTAGLVFSSTAFAGSWNYGCMGKNSNGDQITMNRLKLVVMASSLANAKTPSAGVSDSISTYNSTDENGGLAQEMTFQFAWSPSDNDSVTLKLLSSKAVSNKSRREDCGSSGRVRDISESVFLNTYEVETKASGDAAGSKETILLRCYDNSITTCG